MLKLNMCLQLQARGCISKFTFLLDQRKPQKIIVKNYFIRRKLGERGFYPHGPASIFSLDPQPSPLGSATRNGETWSDTLNCFNSPGYDVFGSQGTTAEFKCNSIIVHLAFNCSLTRLQLPLLVRGFFGESRGETAGIEDCLRMLRQGSLDVKGSVCEALGNASHPPP